MRREEGEEQDKEEEGLLWGPAFGNQMRAQRKTLMLGGSVILRVIRVGAAPSLPWQKTK